MYEHNLICFCLLWKLEVRVASLFWKTVEIVGFNHVRCEGIVASDG